MLSTLPPEGWIKVLASTADDHDMRLTGLRASWQRRQMRRRAGWRARDKYRAQRRAWLRENRRVFAVVAIALLGVVGAFHVMMRALPGDQTWISGFFAGAMFAVLYALRRTPPSAVERWQEGAWGEEATASELAGLARRGWIVLNDLPNGRYNFDHVVLGPSGIFCINSKKSTSRLEVLPDKKTLRLQNRYDSDLTWTDTNLLPRAKHDAYALKRLLEERTGERRLWVEPVIVWWGAFPQEGLTADGVGVVHGTKLVERLEWQPPRAPVRDLAKVAAAIQPGRRRAPRRVLHTWASGRRPAAPSDEAA